MLIFQSQWNIGRSVDRRSRTSVWRQILAVHASFKGLSVAVAVFVFYLPPLALWGREQISMPFHTHTHTYTPSEESPVFWQACWFISVSKDVSSLLVYIKGWISCETLPTFCSLSFHIQLFHVYPDFCNLLTTRCCLRETEWMRSLKRDCGCLGNNLLCLCIICVSPLDSSISNIRL